MAEAIMGFTIFKSHIHSSCIQTRRFANPSSRLVKARPFLSISTIFFLENRMQVSSLKVSRSLKQHPTSTLFKGSWQAERGKSKRASSCKVNGLPDWPLMAIIVEQIEGQRDYITEKSVWHLSDEAIKNVYSYYILFTVWGCLFFGSMKDPYYDSETYRGDGGDGTGHWIYEKQEEMEANAREALWREELIEEIEQKVGGLRELEEAGKKEELVK